MRIVNITWYVLVCYELRFCNFGPTKQLKEKHTQIFVP